MPQWTDKPIVAGSTHIRAVHLTELRTAVRDARVAAGLSRFSFSDPDLGIGTPIRAVHFTELRAALQDLWTHAGMGTIPNWTVGSAPSIGRTIRASDVNDLRGWFDAVDPPSLIGASWTNNTRNWNTKSGWDVQLVYTNVPSGTPNSWQTVRNNVRDSHMAGRNVIVRIDYQPGQPGDIPGQNLPPNESSLSSYLSALTDICNDSLFRAHAWGYIIGNEPNTRFENSGGTPMTPSWYARVFCGYGTASERTDNALQTIRAHQSSARILVGAVGPYNTDANGSPAFIVDVAWLNYFNEMCLHIGQAVESRGLERIDGFAVHAYGRVDDPNVPDYGKDEPHHDVQAPGAAPGAWWGFTVYKNWRTVIDRAEFGDIAGSPMWITETNTRTHAPSKDTADFTKGDRRGWGSAPEA